jgi:DNA mismatch repair protein MutL
MTPEIRELDADTRDRIAAGEVVERPASVVKELLENALDADADRIEVAVEAGGTERVVVSDNGIGMTESDATKAIEEHTTSKLRSVGELDSIGTLGFRGEALHAIGSVARLGIETRPRGGSRGTELVVEHGEVRSRGPTGCPEGTTVEVTDLFENVPARRKYLKTAATEFDHVARIVTGYALARPDVAISLTRDGRGSFATPGDGDRQSAILAVYGREVAAAMIPVESDGGDGPLSSIEGMVSHPETNRASSEHVTTLVDGRYVTSSAIREAIVDAYGRQLASDRYPFAVVDIELPPGGVDVNVHPRKLEVLFADPAEIKADVTGAIKDALSEANVIRTRAPRGRSAAKQTEATPSGQATSEDTDAEATGATATEPNQQAPAESPPSNAARSDSDKTTGSRTESTHSRSDSSGETTRQDASTDPDDAASGVEQPTQQTLEGGTTTGTPDNFEELPSMTVLGQFDDTYVVAETDDGLVLIDQHAADERVNYERLQAAFDGDVTTQTLAEPVTVGATAREMALVDEHGEALARLGFRVQADGDRLLSVRTVPALLADHAGASAPEIARDIVNEFVDGDPEGTVESIVDDVLGDLACHPSITGNTSLREGTVAGLLDALDDCENPHACPHGRPTLIEIPDREIEARFERDYPGHEARRE